VSRIDQDPEAIARIQTVAAVKWADRRAAAKGVACCSPRLTKMVAAANASAAIKARRGGQFRTTSPI
jgi:hypothetical protein